MVRRRRREVRVVRRSLPSFYLCPKCGKNTVRVTTSKRAGVIVVACGSCDLRDTYAAEPTLHDVDAYNRFVDDYYGKREGSQRGDAGQS